MRSPLASFTVAVFCSLAFLSSSAWAVVVNATFNAATDVPVTANGYTALGNTVSFTLGFVPDTGTQLTVVKNTALTPILGQFGNLAQGQAVPLTFAGNTYNFVASYFGGTGNDLVMRWASTRAFAWR